MTKLKYILYRNSKSAMQSGKNNAQKWIVELVNNIQHRHQNNIMNWVASNNTQTQLKYEFQSKEDAIKFLEKNQFEFEIIPPNEGKMKAKSYSENFTN